MKMNRRWFFSGASVATVGLVTLGSGSRVTHVKAEVFNGHGRRVSCVKGDPGERFYAELMAEGRKIKVLLDGVEQPYCITADEANGTVTRMARHSNDKFLVNYSTQEIIEETVRGVVVIEISPPADE